MQYHSTRNKDLRFSLTDAILEGLAPDGGLFFPHKLPEFDIQSIPANISLQDLARLILTPFFDGDDLLSSLDEICRESLNFEIPVTRLDDQTSIMELFHGPTAAFKDVGARFLASCMSRLAKDLTILVATSGDTGSAVASAYHNKPNLKVVVLYPKDKISEFQELQLTSWDNNILSLRTDGDFDICQKLVKSAFSNRDNFENFTLTSANSINIGRLLPQMVYYAYSSLNYFREFSKTPSFVVPTGNMGNVLSCILAKSMGFPIDRIVISSNENKVIPDFFKSKRYTPRESKKTMANAMDVGNPSNMERYLHFIVNYEVLDSTSIHSISVSDDQIRQILIDVYNKFSYIADPHTGTGLFAGNHFQINDSIIVATAHPSKFKNEIEDLFDTEISIPEQLRTLLNNEKKFLDLSPTLEDLNSKMNEFFNP